LGDNSRIYFKGLDTLRAIGALSVVFGHIELSMENFILTTIPIADFSYCHFEKRVLQFKEKFSKVKSYKI
jgi:peptidoglycan/LPS O-acetylase OafA/YrhL